MLFGTLPGLLFIGFLCLIFAWYALNFIHSLPIGIHRISLASPFIILFLIIPRFMYEVGENPGGMLNLTTIISWWTNAKILALCFGNGPLVQYSPTNSPPTSPWILVNYAFILLIPLIIESPKNEQNHQHQQHLTNRTQLFCQSIRSFLICAFCFYLYNYQTVLPSICLHFLYGSMTYFSLTGAYDFLGFISLFFSKNSKPHFQKPYLSTSFQDFWGKRWNLVAGSLLRDSIYIPCRVHLPFHFSDRTSKSISVLLTFLVSGIMHEYILYNGLGNLNGISLEWFRFFFTSWNFINY